MTKCLFDCSVSLAALLLLSPVFLLLVFLVRVKISTTVFFTQVHPGLHGNALTTIKFRTMTNARDAIEVRPGITGWAQANGFNEIQEFFCK